jgi:hypothetical protein
MLEYCALLQLRPFYAEVTQYTADAEWYLRQVHVAHDPKVSYPTRQEVVRSVRCPSGQAVILRDGSTHLRWSLGEWQDYPTTSRAVTVELDYPTAKIEYADGSEALVFSPYGGCPVGPVGLSHRRPSMLSRRALRRTTEVVPKAVRRDRNLRYR